MVRMHKKNVTEIDCKQSQIEYLNILSFPIFVSS